MLSCSVEDGGMKNAPDEARLLGNAKTFMASVGKVQELITAQIETLQDYIPAQKTSYGAEKVSYNTATVVGNTHVRTGR